MIRWLWTLWAALWLYPASSQSPADAPATALSYTRSVAVPLNGLLLFDRVAEAWTWTFGKEPGAKLLKKDREGGALEGLARINFRSEQVLLREETMGVIQYHVTLRVQPGECRITVSDLSHTGNRTTPRGGVHMGLLTRGTEPSQRLRGVGGSNSRKVYAEVKRAAETRITSLLQAFEARLRASAEP